MSDEDVSYEDEWWGDSRVHVPTSLQLPLNLYGSQRRADRAMALARELGLPPSARHATWRVVDGLIEPLAEVLNDVPRFIDDRGIGITKVATKDVDMALAFRALMELGYGRTKLRSAKVADLPGAMREVLNQRLMPFVIDTMNRWQNRGLFRSAPAQNVTPSL